LIAPDPTGTLPALLDLHADADKLSGQLGALERWLRTIAENTEPRHVVYSNSTSGKLESTRVVKSGAGRLFGVSGFSSKASNQFILGFDATSIPANGAVPNFVMQASASDNFWVSWAPNWRDFFDGWVFANSSTSSTLTLGSADCWFDAQYL
jgi:hypothetical protein